MKKIIGFTYSTYFLVLMSTFTLFIWNNNLEHIGIPIVLVLLFLVFVLFKDPMPTVPLLLNALFMVSQTNWSFDTAPLFIYLTPVSIVGGMIIHSIIYKVKFVKGKMLIGVLIMFVAMLLSSINAKELSLYYWFYASVGLLYALFYLFYVNTLEGNHIAYLMKLMLILGILVSLETLLFYFKVEDVVYAVEHKLINLGWGISNYVATYLIMFISITFYYIRTAKYGYFWIPVAIFQMLMLLFTISRGGIVAFIGLFPILVFMTLYKSHRWWKILVLVVVTGLVFAGIVWAGLDLFSALFERFSVLLLDDTGRIEIWVDALAKFKEHPLFGAGIFAREGTRDYNMYHNTFLHVLATMGIIGAGSLVIQLFQQFKITLGKFKVENFFLAAALLGAHAHGLVDNVYLMPQFMILMLLIVSVVEVASRTDLEKVIVKIA
ncbi:MAG: hypothetical protein CVV56_04735 [Tenericutes bacterium HGW-Tenericutes-1]|jgi:O-antigen ligase|nr:MAG: hypothetical protein CVV56_04735 [Tenericutes bacterium HGW-Tenericutes-1]